MKPIKPMTKLEKIVNSPKYKEYCEAIANMEHCRTFCHHDMVHFRETARTIYILWLENPNDSPELEGFSPEEVKEIIYAVGYLHDIGRFLEYEDSQKDHAIESGRLSRPLLQEAGFSHSAIEIIVDAIKNHRKKDSQGFSGLVYLGDKISRPCFTCEALAQCKKFSLDKGPELLL